MRYVLVATTGWLLLVDLHARQVQPLECDRPEYYGISWFQDGDELVLSHSGLNNADLVDVASYAQSERGWLSHGRLDSRPFLSAPHQILCTPDGRVLCANTGRNVITAFDFEKPNVFQEEGISPARWDRLALDQVTGDHLNSVFLRDDRLYVLAHGHGKGSRMATFSYPGMALLSVEALGARTGLHNIWVTADGQRISCHSDNGSLIDLDDRTPLWESGSSIYTRGLAAAGDYVLVGESQVSGRDLRRSSLSGLWIIDRQNWQAIDHVVLGPFGTVHEVRILDVADEAHHGHPFKGLASLLAQDVRLEQSAARLRASTACLQARSHWTGWEAVFGSPAILADGSRQAMPDQLCLMIRQSRPDSGLAFTYLLESGPGAHVSAVVGYQGNGADSRMAALLLQPSGETAVLSVWRHDGTGWAALPDIHVAGLPLAGTLQFTPQAHRASLSVDGKAVISLGADTLGLMYCNHGLGIRWTGASVRPVGGGG